MVDNPEPTSKIPFGSVWNYHAQNAAPANSPVGVDWKQPAYTMPATWNVGASPVAGAGKYGYTSGQATCLPSGQVPICAPVAGNKYTAYYFRKTVSFTATELSTTFSAIQLNMLRNDGIVVYINGTERCRNNMPAGVPAYGTLASANVTPGAAEAVSTNLSTSFFTAGVNTIAVEVHLRSATSVDMSFDYQGLNGQDAHDYYRIARAWQAYMVDGGARPIMAEHPHGYPILGAVLGLMVGPHWALRVISVLAFIGVVFILVHWLRRHGADGRVSRAYVLLGVALSPFLLRYALTTMSDVLGLTLTTAAFFFAVTWIRDRRYAALSGMIVCLALALCVRLAVAPIAVLLLLYVAGERAAARVAPNWALMMLADFSGWSKVMMAIWSGKIS